MSMASQARGKSWAGQIWYGQGHVKTETNTQNVERLEKRIKQLEDAIDRALKSRGFGWQMHGILADVRHTWPEE